MGVVFQDFRLIPTMTPSVGFSSIWMSFKNVDLPAPEWPRIKTNSPSSIWMLMSSSVGVVFQDFRLIPTMTVYENVAFAMRVTNISTKKIKDRVPFALSLVGLEDKMDRLPDELSGGEQQRVAVARALAHGPKLIIADEPTGNIDPEMSMDIMQLFEAINKVNITVVVVTHEHELVHKLARKYGNRVITLANGMVASDTADPSAARCYAAAMAEREADDYEYDED